MQHTRFIRVSRDSKFSSGLMVLGVSMALSQHILFPEIGVVVETLLNGWAIAQAAAEVLLHCFAQHVRARMPEHLRIECQEIGMAATLGYSHNSTTAPPRASGVDGAHRFGLVFVKLKDLERAVGLQHAVKIPQISIDLCNHGIVGEPFAEQG